MSARPEHPGKLTLGHLLAQTCRLVGGRMQVRMEEIGLHRSQGLVLFHLWHQDGIPQKALARALRVRPATATATLQRMERDGWVERRRDPGDQRVVRVHLSPKAHALQGEVRASLKALEREVEGALDPTEAAAFRGYLLRVREHLAAQEPESKSEED